MNLELRNLIRRKLANVGAAQPQGVALEQQDQVNQGDQVNTEQQNATPDGMMQQAEALAPLEVLGNIYQEQAYIVGVLNQNANNIVELLPTLTNSVNMLNQWLMEHAQHEELEDKAFRLQQLVAKQQGVGYTSPQPQAQPQPAQTQQAPPQTQVQTQPMQSAPNSGPPNTSGMADAQGTSQPRGY